MKYFNLSLRLIKSDVYGEMRDYREIEFRALIDEDGDLICPFYTVNECDGILEPVDCCYYCQICGREFIPEIFILSPASV